MSGPCHVGLSIAVVTGGQAAFYDYGSTTRDAVRLADRRSLYEIASVTKTFTGALAARAVVQGRMTLDSDFRAYLPGAYPNLVWNGAGFTLRQLATHRSGLPRDIPDTDALYAQHDFDTLPGRLIAMDRGYGRARYLKALRRVRLRSAPGRTEAYSNLGMKVIGFGLERAQHASFEALTRREILVPLGMVDTGFEVSRSKRTRLVQGYGRSGTPAPYHLRNAGAAYGLYSTPQDMARYVRWQLDETDPVIRLAHQPLVGDARAGQALIWNLALDGAQLMLWHGGGTFGMTSQVVLYPQQGRGYVLLANDTCEGSEDGLKRIATAVEAALGR